MIAARFCLFVGMFMLACGVALATDPESRPQIDADAKNVVDRLAAYFKGLNGFRVTITSKAIAERAGEHFEQLSEQKFSGQRPNKLNSLVRRSSGEFSESTILNSDGTYLTAAFLDKGKKPAARFAAETAPSDWQSLFRQPVAGMMLQSATLMPMLSAIISDDPAAGLLSKNTSVTYLGREKVDGVECHVIRSVADSSTKNAGMDFDWQLWVEAGDVPLVRQSKVTSGTISSKFVKMTIAATFTDWEINPSFSDDAFDFVRPEDATEVSTFWEVLTGKPAVKKASLSVPSLLVGKPAPPLMLDLLDGGKLDLASLRGTDIVILDFWSTSCVACIQTLPIVEKVTKEYQAKGVRLYAVNVGQTADEARKFLQDVNWTGDVPIALDTTGEGAKAYSVVAMPHTAIIGSDGVVHVVRIGKSPNLEKQLRSDLDALLGGNDKAGSGVPPDQTGR